MPNPNPSPETRDNKRSTFGSAKQRSEPLTSKVTVRITDSMLDSLKAQENYREFIREAVCC